MILSELLVKASHSLGDGQDFKASGGSTTTIVCAEFLTSFGDGDLDGASVIIPYTTDTLAPKDQMSAIQTFAPTSNTITVFDPFTVAVGAGDRFTLIGASLPLAELIRLANVALTDLGDIAVEQDVAIATDQQEVTLDYSFAAGLVDVRFKATGDDLFHPYPTFHVSSATQPVLTLRFPPGEGTLRLVRRGVHPEVNAYNDKIQSCVHEAVATAALAKSAQQWKLLRQGVGDDLMANALDDFVNSLSVMMRKHPINVPPKRASIIWW